MRTIALLCLFVVAHGQTTTGTTSGTTRSTSPASSSVGTVANTTPRPGGVAAPSGNGTTTGNATTGAGGDAYPMCCMWAAMGECDSNPFWMKPNCGRACGTPGATIANALGMPTKVSLDCSMGSSMQMMGPGMSMGGFGGGPAMMGPGMSMGGFGGGPAMMGPMMGGGGGFGGGFGGGCSDNHPQCSQWAMTGECDSNPYWMRPNCQRSCQSCGATVANAGNLGGFGGL